MPCGRIIAYDQSSEIVLTPLNETDSDAVSQEDPSPAPSKVWQDDRGDHIIADVNGLRLRVRWRLDNKGYDVSDSA